MFIKRLAAVAVGRLRLGLMQRQKTEAALRTVQVVDGSSEHIAAMVTALERGGWQITARSHD